MKIELGFGNTTQTVQIRDEKIQDILLPNAVPHGLTGASEVRRALREPIASRPLREIVRPGEKIAVITSDITRPLPTWEMMPELQEELYAAGIGSGDITLVFALGSHRRHTEEEKRKLAGRQAYEEIACIDGDINDCVHLGETSRGTPVDIVRSVAEADRRVCLGNIEYHYFAGYSGGAKAIMPGVSTREAIQANHRMMTEPMACAGNIENNPIREDIEEAAAICGVDFILNVVLDEHKKIIRAVAGDVTEAHRAGCAFLDTLYEKKIKERADIVIVSQGGAPKDLNLYQTQKALDNAKHAIREGGIIILAGSCREGLGERTFEEWMTEAAKPEELIERVRRDFKLGGHKAAAIAMVLEKAEIYLVSELEPAFVETLFMTPFDKVQAAYETADAKLGGRGREATVLVMPYGGSTLPRVRTTKENRRSTPGSDPCATEENSHIKGVWPHHERKETKMDYAKESLKLHEKWKGKIEVIATVPVESKEDLSLAYTPGVAQPCLEISDDISKSYELTRRHNMCLVVTDGSAVLGLGNIGAEAGMPVMEGKCVLFKAFGGVDAFPLCVKSQDVDTIVETIYQISGSFGGVNLEDISAPRCFEIERRLKERCDIPIFHDDQHGTAVITLAGIMNALKVVEKKMEEVRVVLNGAGAAAIAITRLLLASGVKDITMCDRTGAIYEGRKGGMNAVKEEMARYTNLEKKRGSLADVLAGADVFIGVSAPGAVTVEMVRTMKDRAVIFACANPTPEIFPEDAKAGGAAVVATGRSDFPNQINNVLAFPGIFRGTFDVRASDINDEMKIAAARALANLIAPEELSADYIIPAAFDRRVGPAVAEAVAEAARRSGVARL